MPRLSVIVLDRDRSDADNTTYNYVLWADVPAARQLRYAKATGTVSAWSGANSQDNTNIVNGVVAETTGSVRVQPGQGIAIVQQNLQAQWTAFQSSVNSSNPWQRYGSTWDGTTWTVVNNS